MQYTQNFLPPTQAQRLFDWSVSAAGVQWQQEQFVIYGRDVVAPRRLAWFGDHGINYRYTGLDHAACGWPAPLLDVKTRVDEAARGAFNFVLLNRYDDGNQYMGWHRDDESAVSPVIASLSLGATRRFRHRSAPSTASHGLDLEHGSLLVFDGRVQHTLTKTRRGVGTRVNLTFRQVQACT